MHSWQAGVLFLAVLLFKPTQCVGAHRVQKIPGAGVPGLVSHPVWVSGTELLSSVRVRALNH